MNRIEVIKPLTSLRFLFAMMVFLSHLNWVKNEDFKNIFNKTLQEGYLGVSFFFVLSGFVLALNYKGREIDIKEFYVSRIARIYPVYLLTILMVLPLEIWVRTIDLKDWYIRLIINALCLQSFIPDMSYYFTFNWPSWSISAEFFFYFLFPFLIVYDNKYIKFVFFVIALVIVFSIKSVSQELVHALFYINPVFRIVDFFIGILVCNIFVHTRIKFSKWGYSLLEISSILIFVLFFYFHDQVGQGYRYSVYYWIPVAYIIFIFSYQKGIVSDFLSNKTFMVLGEISFSFYLVHQIIMRYYEYMLKERGFSIAIDDVFIAVIIFVLSLLISYVLYKYVEMPCNRAIRKVYKARIGVPHPSAIH